MYSNEDNKNVERVRPEGGYLYQFLQEQAQEQAQAAQSVLAEPEAECAMAGC